MQSRAMLYLEVAGRAILEVGLCLVGLLRLRPLLTPATPKKRIALQVYAVHLAQFYRPIVEALTRDQENCELVFMLLPHPHFSRAEQRQLRNFVQTTLGVPGTQVKPYWGCLWERFDVLVCLDVYARFPYRKTRKILLMHGPGLTRRNVDRQFFRKTVCDFDMVLVSGEADHLLLDGFVKQRKAPVHVSAVGFPFLDDLQRLPGSREAYLDHLGLDTERRTILVAPSWVGLRRTEVHGIDWLAGVISSLRGLDLNILLKLHAGSFNRVMAGNVAWHPKLQQLAASCGGRIDFDIDDRPAMAHTDVLITDISSRAFNFMLLDKPVILYWPFTAPRDAWDEERLEMLQRGAQVAKTPRDIRTILQQPYTAMRADEQRRLVAERYFTNYGSATQAVVALLQANS
jgi:hypothetical protein